MNSRYEILAKEKGYFVDRQGNAYSPRGNKVGTRGKDPYLYLGESYLKQKLSKYIYIVCKPIKSLAILIFNDNIEVRHLNGNSFDNSFKNLAIGTPSENAMDKPESKRKKISLVASNKLKVYSDELVLEIQKMREAGMTYTELRKKYNIKSKSSLNYILKRKVSRNGADG